MDITYQCTKEWLLDAIQDVNGKAVLTSNQLQVKEANLASQRLKAFVGYAWMDTLDSDKWKLEFGRWNDRPVNQNEVTKLVQSFKGGLLRMAPENAMPAIIKKSHLVNGVDFYPKDIKLDQPNGGLPELNVSAVARTLGMFGGQHRREALCRLACDLRKTIEMNGEKIVEKQEALKRSLDEEKAIELKSLKEEKADAEVDLKTIRYWAVALYDDGECGYGSFSESGSHIAAIPCGQPYLHAQL